MDFDFRSDNNIEREKIKRKNNISKLTRKYLDSSKSVTVYDETNQTQVLTRLCAKGIIEFVSFEKCVLQKAIN